jgi:hypothetical protein
MSGAACGIRDQDQDQDKHVEARRATVFFSK